MNLDCPKLKATLGCRYDSHRDAILRSGSHQTGTTGSEGWQRDSQDGLNLYQYFSPSCFTGYSEGPTVRWPACSNYQRDGVVVWGKDRGFSSNALVCACVLLALHRASTPSTATFLHESGSQSLSKPRAAAMSLSRLHALVRRRPRDSC
jgi:hypothetical protein